MSNSARLINLNITFRNTQATDAIKGYANDKITNCLSKFVHQDTEANIVLSVEKNRQIAEISFRSDGHTFNGKEE
ncbi:MAG: ribosome-associated translation inhibitor RaiA, partial [Bdellovibrionales bacterium]|nr:ribosome-associated translation inhibitor RaiA [Bdellovibrionales bacterium]